MLFCPGGGVSRVDREIKNGMETTLHQLTTERQKGIEASVRFTVSR